MIVFLYVSDKITVQLPQFENRYYVVLFYIVFIVLGSFFTLNLFVTVIVDNFSELKKKLELKGKAGGQDIYITYYKALSILFISHQEPY